MAAGRLLRRRPAVVGEAAADHPAWVVAVVAVVPFHHDRRCYPNRKYTRGQLTHRACRCDRAIAHIEYMRYNIFIMARMTTHYYRLVGNKWSSEPPPPPPPSSATATTHRPARTTKTIPSTVICA